MMVYLLFYSQDNGDREDWNVFYTPVEVFSTPALRLSRQLALAAQDPHLQFHTQDLQVDA